MKILYTGNPPTHDAYIQGLVPSHWFYGAVQMEQAGNTVIWEWERRNFFNDIVHLIKYKPDIVFIPNLNIKNHLLLLLLAWLHVIRTPIYAYLHHAPKLNEGLKTRLCKILLPALKHVFFLSDKSMYETLERGFIGPNKCSVPGWGADRDFYDKVKTADNGYFVSTGKENRDFDILIEAFRRTGAPLKILTAKSHAGSDYTDLKTKCKDIPNIEVILTENSSNVFPMMLEAMAQSKALVCPLRKDRLDYCVGLSTIVDAEGLHKPLIITLNPYHSVERTKSFQVVETVDDWTDAIRKIQLGQCDCSNSEYSMESAYEKMVREVRSLDENDLRSTFP